MQIRTFSLVFLALFLCLALRSNAQQNFEIPYFNILGPASIANIYARDSLTQQFGIANFGPGISNGAVLAEVVLASPDSLFCDSTNTNYSGKIVLISRGTCEFSRKMRNAEIGGAVGVIIWNRDEAILSMGQGSTIPIPQIPGIFVPRSVGLNLYNAIRSGQTVNVSLSNVPVGFSILQGKVWGDENNNCQPDPATENGLKGVLVTATKPNGVTYMTQTNATGRYVLGVDTSGPVSINFQTPGGLWLPCTNNILVPGGQSGQIQTLDLVMKPSIDCAQLDANIFTPRLRRCFENNFKTEVCNIGTLAATDAYVVVDLPNELDPLINASQPFTVLTNGNYRFELGTIGVAECKTITFNATANCDSTVLGETLCFSAHAYPDSACNVQPLWSGASVSLTGRCLSNEVEFVLKNTGTSPMTEPKEFIIIEDDVMRPGGTFQLGPNAEKTLKFPANGSTWYVQAGQERYHPVPGSPALALEGCAVSGNTVSTGFSLMFPVYESSYSEDIECQEVIGAFDPNDKQGFPKGYGDRNLIGKNIPIDYMIRFQNTGTDTAFNVVVRDTLSPYLDVSSLRVDGTSHTYDLSIERGNILIFKFPNLLLVDSFTNERLSHGYIRYRIGQKKDNPLGTSIRNRAGIYFDFNLPVITNYSEHEVGTIPTVTALRAEPGEAAVAIQIAPNLLGSNTWINVKTDLPNNAAWRLVNMQGGVVANGTLQTKQGFNLPVQQINTGTYVLEFWSGNKKLGISRIIMQ